MNGMLEHKLQCGLKFDKTRTKARLLLDYGETPLASYSCGVFHTNKFWCSKQVVEPPAMGLVRAKGCYLRYSSRWYRTWRRRNLFRWKNGGGSGLSSPTTGRAIWRSWRPHHNNWRCPKHVPSTVHKVAAQRWFTWATRYGCPRAYKPLHMKIIWKTSSDGLSLSAFTKIEWFHSCLTIA